MSHILDKFNPSIGFTLNVKNNQLIWQKLTIQTNSDQNYEKVVEFLYKNPLAYQAASAEGLLRFAQYISHKAKDNQTVHQAKVQELMNDLFLIKKDQNPIEKSEFIESALSDPNLNAERLVHLAKVSDEFKEIDKNIIEAIYSSKKRRQNFRTLMNEIAPQEKWSINEFFKGFSTKNIKAFFMDEEFNPTILAPLIPKLSSLFHTSLSGEELLICLFRFSKVDTVQLEKMVEIVKLFTPIYTESELMVILKHFQSKNISVENTDLADFLTELRKLPNRLSKIAILMAQETALDLNQSDREVLGTLFNDCVYINQLNRFFKDLQDCPEESREIISNLKSSSEKINCMFLLSQFPEMDKELLLGLIQLFQKIDIKPVLLKKFTTAMPQTLILPTLLKFKEVSKEDSAITLKTIKRMIGVSSEHLLPLVDQFEVVFATVIERKDVDFLEILEFYLEVPKDPNGNMLANLLNFIRSGKAMDEIRELMHIVRIFPIDERSEILAINRMLLQTTLNDTLRKNYLYVLRHMNVVERGLAIQASMISNTDIHDLFFLPRNLLEKLGPKTSISTLLLNAENREQIHTSALQKWKHLDPAMRVIMNYFFSKLLKVVQ